MPSKRSGFTLIEVVVVMIIFAVVLAMAAKIGSAFQAAAARSGTDKRLRAVEEALTNFVITSRRLPCPADGALPSSDVAAGREKRTDGVNCDGNQVRGVVPWATLGITELDATDLYGTRLTYRVATPLVLDEAMNFSSCDGAGKASVGTTGSGCRPCTSGAVGAPDSCTGVATAIAGKGLEIRALGMGAGDVVASPATNTGAAYLLMSHGENHGGGYGASGAVQAAVDANGAPEDQNAATAALQAFYVDDNVSVAPHFDDLLLRRTILDVVSRAGLGPRVHQPCPSPGSGTCPAI